MITRLFGSPRLVVRTSIAMFAVVAIVLAAVLLLIAIQGSHYVRETVTDKLTAGRRMLSALEQRQSRELQAQVEILAESPTLKAAIDTYQSELAVSDVDTRAELILTQMTPATLRSLADAFDAMTSARAYHPGLDPGDAIRELWRCAGTQFDAEAVQSLVSALAVAGPGTLPALPGLDRVTFTAPRRLALAGSRG